MSLPGMRSAFPVRRNDLRRCPGGTGLLVAELALLLSWAGAFAQTTTYRTEEAFPGLTFNQPLGFATPPGENDRLFIVEKPGRIQTVTGLASSPVKQQFLDLSARVLTGGEQGLLGLAFHPDFATNRYFYVFYCTTATTGAGSGAHNRLSRFTALAAPATNADILATEVPLISQFDEAANHNGGDLHFGTDGYLYVALGDEGGANDQYNNSQRIDKDFFSGLLRIDVDLRANNLAPSPHPAVHAGTYRVPADNPFITATAFNGVSVNPANVRDEFWAVGLRNPWRFSFDAPTGRLFVGDVGQSAREEIDLVMPGGNYGWSYREGLVAGPRSNPPAGAVFVDPIWDADRSVAGSITGGLVYRGSRFADLAGRYIFADYVQSRVFAMTLPASGPVQVQALLTESTPAALGADPRNGDILIASLGNGVIRRLVVDAAPPPTTPPPTTPPSTPAPPPSGGGGGGGAVSAWFIAAVGILGLFRWVSRSTSAG
jgi:glucose/arabinose dehydrogenase